MTLHFEVTESDADLVVKLSPEHREILTKSGRYDAIAAEMRLPVGTVKSRLNRARKALVKLRNARDENRQTQPKAA